jgi:RNA polymerase sigma-70 factor (ECF subfamily)
MDNGASSYRRFLEGDLSAFEEIIDAYKDSLIFFINRYVSDLDLAEDIAADTFATLLMKPEKYNFSVSLKTYIFTIGKNRAIDILRKRQRHGTVSLDVIPADTVSEESFIEDVLRDEEKKRLHDAINRLKKEYREAVHLVYFENMSVSEAAAVMGRGKRQVENLLYRARKALKETLGSEDEL